MSATLLIALLAAPADARNPDFDAVISRVESMVWDGNVNSMVRNQGLDLVNVTWEDTGRYKGSVWGPNISDMTIGVRDSSGALHPMPVIRFDNYTDKTADIDSDAFWLRVGNEDGRRLRTVSLSSMLKDVRSYLTYPNSWRGSRRSLWASRDAHVLVSAQACFLPIPRYGEATFTPVIYNYQSYPGNPAVLTMVATREGTSIQVVENRSGYMSEVLYFNQAGERAPFTAIRQREFVAQGGDAVSPYPSNSDDEGLNVVLVIQVPLKQRPEPPPRAGGYLFDEEMSAAPSASAKMLAPERSDVDNAVVGHGETEGAYDEVNGLAIERDPRFPVRVTVQFYKATSNGVVSRSDIAAIRRQIDQVYSEGDYVGSLVTSGPTWRSTEWTPPPYPVAPMIPEATEDAHWAEPSWGWLKAD